MGRFAPESCGGIVGGIKILKIAHRRKYLRAKPSIAIDQKVGRGAVNKEVGGRHSEATGIRVETKSRLKKICWAGEAEERGGIRH